jgi:hypothetical protein
MAIEIADIAGPAGTVLLAAATAMNLARLFGLAGSPVLAAGAAAVAVLFVPVGGFSLLAYAYSVTGPLGAATLVMLAVGAIDAAAPTAGFGSRSRIAFLAATVLVVSVLFYPPALGLGRFDPYELGYAGRLLPAGLLAYLVFAVLKGSLAAILWLAVASILFLGGAYETRNLIDYLIDPIAVPVAIVVLLSMLIGRRLGRSKAEAQAAISRKAATTSS